MALDTDEFVPLELFPDVVVRAAFFERVTNGGALREQILAKTLPCAAALVDASLVLSTAVLRSAATQAARRADHGASRRPHVCRSNDAPKSRAPETDLVYSPRRIPGAFGALVDCVAGERRPLAALDADRDGDRDAAIAAYFSVAPGSHETLERNILTKLATKDVSCDLGDGWYGWTTEFYRFARAKIRPDGGLAPRGLRHPELQRRSHRASPQDRFCEFAREGVNDREAVFLANPWGGNFQHFMFELLPRGSRPSS
ncbi:hypothetical protein JL722_6324 [Aureococcus anophagefferens]|nr:hypothetical protein JL722_6324 [Aureococcus anophagefferens]